MIRRSMKATLAVAMAISGIFVLIAHYDNTKPITSANPLPAITDLLQQRVGFGAGASGGANGSIVHVTNDHDSGMGSLRAAVSGDTPKWIVFDGDYTIRVQGSGKTSGVNVGSNTTIDGRGHHVTITGCTAPSSASDSTCANQTFGLELNAVQNVILENLTLSGFGDITKTVSNDPYDVIDIIKGSHDIWLDHLSLTHAGNKTIFVGYGSSNITVSWSHFYDQEQTFQVGSQSTDSPNNTGHTTTQTVTLHHNYFDGSQYRNPVAAYAHVHVFNDYVKAWTVYGTRSERLDQLISENNIYEAASNTRATIYTPDGTGCNDDKSLCDGRYGYLQSRGDITLGGAKILQNNTPGTVCKPGSPCESQSPPADSGGPITFFTIPYSYTPDAVNSAPTQQNLISLVAAKAGWQQIGLDLNDAGAKTNTPSLPTNATSSNPNPTSTASHAAAPTATTNGQKLVSPTAAMPPTPHAPATSPTETVIDRFSTHPAISWSITTGTLGTMSTLYVLGAHFHAKRYLAGLSKRLLGGVTPPKPPSGPPPTVILPH